MESDYELTAEERQAIRDEEDRQMARAFVEGFSRYANQQRSTPMFIEAMNREHRTLQQLMMTYFLNWCVHLADLKPGWYDLRNEGSVEAARKIVGALGDRVIFNGSAHLPYI